MFVHGLRVNVGFCNDIKRIQKSCEAFLNSTQRQGKHHFLGKIYSKGKVEIKTKFHKSLNVGHVCFVINDEVCA